jgi:hypothetical protein
MKLGHSRLRPFKAVGADKNRQHSIVTRQQTGDEPVYTAEFIRIMLIMDGISRCVVSVTRSPACGPQCAPKSVVPRQGVHEVLELPSQGEMKT